MDGKRCAWCTGDPLYVKYHDEEWGVPVYEDDELFEFLVLESFQASLSWITILRKRENFCAAFNNFDYRLIAEYDENKIEQLMNNPGIVRNRRKILATINNAARFIEVQQEFGSFSNHIWNFVDGEPIINKWTDASQVPATTALSDRIAKDLKKRGFGFLGSTVIYAHMQATGMVNDHTLDCFKRQV
ncbi:MAG: DNA-3-methyladenine glycosylase I [Chryseobacterium sp.]|nr:MAG: DNA-3-methyladenine glycosylase I [Chryseobacterium sp.]